MGKERAASTTRGSNCFPASSLSVWRASAIGRAVRALLSDRALHGRIVIAARERARREYDMKRVVTQVEQVYEQWATKES